MKMHVPILSTIEKAAIAGQREAARAVLKLARELSPTDTGQSDKSGFTASDDLTVQVGFTSHISRIQHENLEYQHPGGGVPKFLEVAEANTDVAGIIAKKVRDALG